MHYCEQRQAVCKSLLAYLARTAICANHDAGTDRRPTGKVHLDMIMELLQLREASAEVNDVWWHMRSNCVAQL